MVGVIAILSVIAQEPGPTLSSAEAADTFGTKQVIGMVLGVALAVVRLATAPTGQGGPRGETGATGERDRGE